MPSSESQQSRIITVQQQCEENGKELCETSLTPEIKQNCLNTLKNSCAGLKSELEDCVTQEMNRCGQCKKLDPDDPMSPDDCPSQNQIDQCRQNVENFCANKHSPSEATVSIDEIYEDMKAIVNMLFTGTGLTVNNGSGSAGETWLEGQPRRECEDKNKAEPSYESAFDTLLDLGTRTSYSVPGRGPNCETNEELARIDTMLCGTDIALYHVKTNYEELRDQGFERAQIIEILTDLIQAEIETGVCDCNVCTATFGGNGGDKNEEQPEQEPTYQQTLNASLLEVKSNYDVIPRGVGRYPVGGNIIYMSEPSVRLIQFEAVNDKGVSELKEELQTTVDVAIAIGYGRVDNVQRLWFNDVLVYNTSLAYDDGIVDDSKAFSSGFDFSGFTSSNISFERLAFVQPTIELYNGDEYQLPMHDGEEGTVPGYRGIAVIVLKNLDLNILGGSFPKILVDASAGNDIIEAPDRVSPTLSFTPSTFKVSNLDQTPFMYSVADDEIVLLNPVDLTEEGDTIDVSPDLETFAVLDDNSLVYTTATELIVNGFTETVGIVPYSLNTLALNVNGETTDFVVVQDIEGALEVWLFNSTGLTNIGSFAGVDDFDLIKSFITYNDQGAELVQFMTDYTDILIRRIALIRYGEPEYEFIDETQTFKWIYPDPEDIEEIDTIIHEGAILWGSWRTLDSAEVIRSVVTANSFLLLNTSEGGVRAMLNSAYELITLEETDIVYPTILTSGVITSNLYPFVISDGRFYTINLTTSEQELIGTTSLLPASDYQYAAPNGAVLYVNGDTLVRANPLRKVANLTDIATIYRRLMIAAGIAPWLINTDLVSSEDAIWGLAITAKTSLGEIFKALNSLYQTEISVDNLIRVISPENLFTELEFYDIDISSTATSETIYPDTDIGGGYTIEFINIDDVGILELEASVYPPVDVDRGSVEQIKLPFVLNDDQLAVQSYLERKISIDRETNTLTIHAAPKGSRLQVPDVISLMNKYWRVNSLTIAPNNNITATFNEVSDTVLSELSSFTRARTLAGASEGAAAFMSGKPYLMFANAITDYDVTKSQGRGQVVYVGIDSAVEEFDPQRVGFFFTRPPVSDSTFRGDLGNSKSFYTSSLTKPVLKGVLETAPDNPTNQWTTSKSDIIVEFTADTSIVEENLFQTPAPHQDILNRPLTNLLLVGREWLQAANYEVLDSNRIRFYNLARGVYGSEIYMKHDVGESVVLYTPDRVKPVYIDDSRYTRKGYFASATLTGITPMGVLPRRTLLPTHPAASHPWAPVVRKIERTFGSFFSTSYSVSLSRRRAFYVDHLTNLNNLPEDFTIAGYGVEEYDFIEDWDDTRQFEAEENQWTNSWNPLYGSIQVFQDPEEYYFEYFISYVTDPINAGDYMWSYPLRAHIFNSRLYPDKVFSNLPQDFVDQFG